MSQENKELYEFGSFRLDVGEHTLTRLDGTKNGQLPEKAFQTLCLLVQKSGRLVAKRDLIDQVWPDSFVEENNLDKCIHAIRHVLGEKSGEQKYIETVRKHGYRFVATVRTVEKPNEAVASLQGSVVLNEHDATKPRSEPVVSTTTTQSGAFVVSAKWARELDEKIQENGSHHEGMTAADPQPTVQPSRTIWTAWKSVAALTLLLAGAGAFGYFMVYRSFDSAAVASTKSIAVLPLKPVNSASRDEIYEIGIAYSLILKLSSEKGFVVRQLSAIRKYADINQDPLVAGKEQHVDYVLDSNYQLSDGKIKVTSQLIDVASGQIEETYKSEKDVGNIFAMQDAIADEVGNNLSARFGIAPSGSVAKHGTNNEEAYRHYLQGIYLVDRRNPAEAREGLEELEQAVGLDPNYAQAWAGIAHAHRVTGGIGRNANTGEEYQKSIEATNKALALDENLADAHSALCDNKMQYEWDFAGAERECKRAIELAPNSARSHQIYSRYLDGRGRFDESISEVKTAIDLEPASLFNQRVYGSSLYYARRYDEAAAQLKRVLAMDPNFANTLPWLWQSLELQGNYPEAFEWFMKYQVKQKAEDETIQAYNTAYQTSGWPGVLHEAASRFENSNLVYFHVAVMNARAGNKDKAFEYLEKSYQRRELWMNVLKVDPGLDSIRDDPRFDELVRRVESK